MTEKEICDILCHKGFDEKTSSILAENLIRVNPELLPYLKGWLEKGVETDYQAQDVSLKGLMIQYDMQYQAALLTMDWILKDPGAAIEAVKKGIR
ncbi:MAG: hypothetical protein HDS42_00235 [Bacteroides sp.]|nr:hypothetical protein [Bacteroides sp.]